MQNKIEQLISTCSTIILEKETEIRTAVLAIISGGHILIEDLPGVGKTTMVQALAKLLGLDSKRVQFTIDTLPSDIIGVQIFNNQEQKFQFLPGPIFSQILIADELNRTSPRTQSALLQAMEEGYVTVDGHDYDLPKPFCVIATQNPQTQTGTFPLPESQLDRFLVSLELNYASKETEIKLLQLPEMRQKLNALERTITPDEIVSLQKMISDISVPEVVARYVADLLENSRLRKIESGTALSTRAGLSMVKMAKAVAYLDKRQHLRIEDIQDVFVAVAGHRLGGSFGVQKGKTWAHKILSETAIKLV